MKSYPSFLLRALALAALPLLSSVALAQTNGTWTTNATGGFGDTGNWSDATKWTATGVPSGGGNATFGGYANDRVVTVDTSTYAINSLTIIPRTTGFSARNFTLNTSGGGALQLGAGGILVGNGGTTTLNVPIELTANQTWTTNSDTAAGAVVVNGVVSGAFSLTRNAIFSQPITFTGANTFSGGFINNSANTLTRIGGNETITSGAIASGALGTGTITLNAGSLSSNGGTARTISNNVLVTGTSTLGNSAQTGALTFSDVGLTTASTFTLGSANNGNVSVVRVGGTNLTFNQVIAESGGAGQSVNFASTSGAPTVTINRTKTAGGNILSGGVALVLNNGAANSGSLLAINGSVTATGANKFSSGALISDNAAIVATDATNFSEIAGGQASVYNNGRVSFATDQTQATVAGLFTSDSQLRLGLGSGSGSATVTQNYNQSAIGNGRAGLVSASTGTITYNGTLTAGSDNTYRVGGGLGTLALTNALTGNGSNLNVEGGGTLTSNATNTYTGATAINGTTFTVSGLSGALSGTSSVAVNNGSTLNLTNNTGAVNANRIADTATISLSSSTINLNGTSTGAIAETLGNLTFEAGRSTITVATTPAAATIKTLQFGTLTRNNNALAIIRGDALGSGTARNEIKVTSSPTLVGGNGTVGTTTISILPWARSLNSSAGAPNTFVTYDTNGFRPLNTTTEFVQSNNTTRVDQAITAAGGASDYNVRFVTPTGAGSTLLNTANGSVTLNSFILDASGASGGAYTQGLNGGTINITSGALMIRQTPSQNMTVNGGTFAFGSAEAVISVEATNAFLTTLGNTFTGSGGFSIYTQNASTVALSGSNTVTGLFTFGGAGIIAVDNDTRFGNAANSVVHAGGGLQFFSGMTSSRGLTLLGNVGSNTLLNNTTSNVVTWTGDISGAGLLRLVNNASVVGTGGFSLGGNNTYSGGTQIEGIAVTGTTNNALGTGTVTLIGANNNAASLALTGSAPTLGGLRATDGTVTINPTAASATLTVGSNNESTVFNGVIAQGAGKTGSLTKTGNGTLVLGGSNTYTGATTVNAGTLLVNGSLSSSSAVTVNAGGTIGGSGRIGGSLTLDGGNLRPGNSPGLLTVGSLALNSGNTTFEINNTGRGTTYDAIDISSGGAVQFGGTLVFDFGNVADFANNTTFNLFSFNTTSSGDFSSVSSIGYAGYIGTWSDLGDVWSFSAGNGQTLTFSELNGSLTVVPEPTTWALVAISMTTVMVLRRRRRA